MKKLLAVLLTLAVGMIMFCIPAAAEDIQAPLTSIEWQGKYPLKSGNCYFITKNTSLTQDVTVPEGAMLVVTDKATLKLSGRLTVKGAIVVHYGSKINVQKSGMLLLGKTSVAVANGQIAVSRGGKIRNYGYLQSTGTVAVKGIIKNYSSGTFTCEKTPRTYAGGKLSGRRTNPSGPAQYYVQELESLADDELILTDTSTGRTAQTNFTNSITLIRSAEAILYKYELSTGTQAFPSLGGEPAPVTDNRSVAVKPVGNYPQPLEFGLNKNGLLYITTTSAKDGTTTSDVYKPCLGAEDSMLFMSFFGKAVPSWNPALTDNLSSALNGSTSVILAECTGEDADSMIFRTLEVIKGGDPAKICAGSALPDGSFVMIGTDDGRYFSFDKGCVYLLPLETSYTDPYVYGDYIIKLRKSGTSYVIEECRVNGIEYSLPENISTLDDLKSLITNS